MDSVWRTAYHPRHHPIRDYDFSSPSFWFSLRSGMAPRHSPAASPSPPSASTQDRLSLLLSPRQVASNEDPPQGILSTVGHHWGADLQVPEGVQAAHRAALGFPSHIAKIRTLVGETESGWWSRVGGGCSPGRARMDLLCSELLKEGAGKAAHSSDGNTEPRQGSGLFNNSCMQGPRLRNTQAL